jgi:hypothetical protein
LIKEFIVSGDHSEKIQFATFSSFYANLFLGKLPAIGYIAFLTYLAFIAKEQINIALPALLF